MNTYRIKWRGLTPSGVYLEGTPRPKKKIKTIVNPREREKYLRRMMEDLQEREKEMLRLWAEAAARREQKGRDEGFREGFAAGREEGYEEGRESVKPIADKLSELTEHLVEERKKIIEGASRMVVELAYEIARRVVHDEISQRKDAVLKQVESALKKIVDKEKVVVRVHPGDLELVKEQESTWRAVVDGIKYFSVVEDKQLEPGDVVIETNSGIVDARIEVQLAHIKRVLTEVLENEPPG